MKRERRGAKNSLSLFVVSFHMSAPLDEIICNAAYDDGSGIPVKEQAVNRDEGETVLILLGDCMGDCMRKWESTSMI